MRCMRIDDFITLSRNAEAPLELKINKLAFF